MTYVKTEVRPSTIFGKGLFAAENVPRGTIVCFFAIGAEVIEEKDFLKAIQQEHFPIIRTATRYAGKYYTHGNLSEDYTYINHSFMPNLLCHCGIVIARQDIPLGEELTMDYRTLVDDTDIGLYKDATTGQEIRGLNARQTLLRTARELIEIVEGVEGWDG